jgi:hypothetical protein
MKRRLNIVGPQIRRLRCARGWSQNTLAIKLQIAGMEFATQQKVAKIESREVWVSDDDLLFISRVLGVDVKDLYPPKILSARRLYDAIAEAKASRHGCLVAASAVYTGLGVGGANFLSMLAGV